MAHVISVLQPDQFTPQVGATGIQVVLVLEEEAMTDPSTLQAAYNFASAGMPVLWIDVRKRYLAEDLKVWMGKGG